jgi:hypothetical protein
VAVTEIAHQRNRLHVGALGDCEQPLHRILRPARVGGAQDSYDVLATHRTSDRFLSTGAIGRNVTLPSRFPSSACPRPGCQPLATGAQPSPRSDASREQSRDERAKSHGRQNWQLQQQQDSGEQEPRTQQPHLFSE